jgi:uncharacterized protein YndB with AHSA1/START domain
MDACVGGQIVESISDGRTCVWGTVTAWEPPHRVAFTWHPGRDAGQATAVEVSFLGHGDHTEVMLVHRGWDARLDSVAARRGYDSGWDIVLGRYVDRCSTGV